MTEVRGQRSEVRRQRSETQNRLLPSRRVHQTFFLSILSSVLCLLCSDHVVQAQESKIGYLNLTRVFEDYQRTKDSNQVLEQQSSQKQTELEGRFNELKKMRQGLELLSDQAREPKLRDIEEKSDEFQRLKTRSERNLLRERNELAREIVDEIERVVGEYAKANGFSVILDQRSLLYGESLHDVTDEVLTLLNERYVAKSAKKR